MKSSIAGGRSAAGVRPLFALGRVVATPTALYALKQCGIDPMRLLERHVTGDWGDLHPVDVRQNELGARLGLRILSSYPMGPEDLPPASRPLLWIVTEANRGTTTFLLPEDY
ncbi:hypothetical protein RCH10_005477 [Variovorax sp. GrIS 2.14]|uniref:type I restriction endonuclease subunit M n=1 Tax=Variovorax sp. GrIS 2.14 TaxID=3071709 RepID=UPI0038F5FF30